jgi:hypothetical protein
MRSSRVLGLAEGTLEKHSDKICELQKGQRNAEGTLKTHGDQIRELQGGQRELREGQRNTEGTVQKQGRQIRELEQKLTMSVGFNNHGGGTVGSPQVSSKPPPNPVPPSTGIKAPARGPAHGMSSLLRDLKENVKFKSAAAHTMSPVPSEDAKLPARSSHPAERNLDEDFAGTCTGTGRGTA